MILALISIALLSGIILIFLEIFVIPGTTIFGIFGTILCFATIYFAYTLLGTNYGHLSIIIGFIVFMIFFLGGKKFMDKSRMSLHEELKGKVNVYSGKVQINDTGVAHTDIKPNGKAIIGDEKLEVYSTGQYISKGDKIIVTNINQNKIIIKPLN